MFYFKILGESNVRVAQDLKYTMEHGQGWLRSDKGERFNVRYVTSLYNDEDPHTWEPQS